MTAPTRLTDALADRYRIERELGAGGMATVYLAEDLKHRRKVAIKVLRPELSAVLGSERFLKEIELTASLQHPNILPLFDSGAAHPSHPERSESHPERSESHPERSEGSAGLLYYVMPYVEGETLRARLEREHQLPIPETIRIATAVASALDYAHRHGAVHRDIKPENILLSEDSVLVADFGIALALRDAGGSRLTETGLSLGTPQYMSPEQATGDRNVDARTDIYSLGSVLYEMLAGEPPFSGPTTQAVIAKLVTERPARLRTLRETVPPSLEATVDRAIAKAPADRFASCREFGEALAAAPAHSLGSGAMAAETWSAPSPGAARRPWIVTAAAALVLLAIVSLAWAALRNRAPAAAVPLERVQLTFTGNATAPGISHDGTKVAYATRQCDSAGRCTIDIVVQDVAGAGVATVLRGLLQVWNIRWTPDGRHLVFMGNVAGRVGTYSMPALGGNPLFLGCCTFSMGNGDTVVVTDELTNANPLPWVRWITASDGAVHDSLAIKLDPERLMDVAQLAGPRGLLVSYWRRQGSTTVVMNRAARVVDSLAFRSPNEPDYWFVPPGREGVAYWFPRAGSSREYDLVLYRIEASGAIGPPDTVFRQLAITSGGDLQHGAEVFAYGLTQSEVWTLSRRSTTSSSWTQRRIAMGTEHLPTTLSNDGSFILIGRGSPKQPGRTQLYVIPFDSGPATPIGAPEDLVDFAWSTDGKSVISAARRNADTVIVKQTDLATQRTSIAAALPGIDFVGVEPLPAGGLLLLLSTEVRRTGIHGLIDSSLSLKDLLWFPKWIAASPDGQDFAAVGFISEDSIRVFRVSVATGRAIRLGDFRGFHVDPPKWLADGSIVIPVFESLWNRVLYKVPAGGGPPEQLLSPPRSPARYQFSMDGKRALAKIDETPTDIYMIPHFGEVLK